jgi:hypothetical protein
VKEKTREALRDALFEAAFVVFGVVLALAANEWAEDRTNRRRAESALASIKEELATNRAAVKESLDYHSGLLETIRSRGEDSPPLGVRDFSRGFLSPARVYRTAWDSAGATGAFTHLRFAKVLLLSKAYEQQEGYERQAQSIAPIIYEELYRGGTGAILANQRNLANLIGTFAYRERELLQMYDETLASF